MESNGEREAVYSLKTQGVFKWAITLSLHPRNYTGQLVGNLIVIRERKEFCAGKIQCWQD
jgi:hypothetical protein